MKIRKKRRLCIIILTIIAIIQFLYMMHTSWIGNTLNPFKLSDKVDINNIIYTMGLEVLKEEISKDNIDRKNILILMDKEIPINTGLYEYYTVYNLYPHNFVRDDITRKGLEANIEMSAIEEIIKWSNVDYIICYFSCNIFKEYFEDQNETYKFVLLKVDGDKDGDKYENKFEISFKIEDYYNYFKENNKMKEFNEFMKYFYNNAKDYKDEFSKNTLLSLKKYIETNKQDTDKQLMQVLKKIGD